MQKHSAKTRVQKSNFIELCKASYAECKDFWDVDAKPRMPEKFEISGENSNLSSIEAVTFISSIEERLYDEGLEISFIDHFMEIDTLSITVDSMYDILKKCSA